MKAKLLFILLSLLLINECYSQINENSLTDSSRIIIIKEIPIPKPVPNSNNSGDNQITTSDAEQETENASQTIQLDTASSTASLTADIGGN
ncbi:MAG: hypothetical protein IKP88_14695 [Lachnospiraceae bacterium]|nr:hypothetical protein [Lachnospiraceae bacterium]